MHLTEESLQGSKTFLVCRCSSTEFAVSVVELSAGSFNILKESHSSAICGDAFDAVITDHVYQRFFQTYRQVPRDAMSKKRALEQCMIARHALSVQERTRILIAEFCNGISMDFSIGRPRIERLLAPFFRQAVQLAQSSLLECGKTAHAVLLVGGCMRMPKFQESFQSAFGDIVQVQSDPESTILRGAAILAHWLGRKGQQFSNQNTVAKPLPQTPMCLGASLGVRLQNNQMFVLIPRNSSLPAQRTFSFSTALQNTTFINIYVHEGEQLNALENPVLGRISLTNIPPAPKHLVEVTLVVDTRGSLLVYAQVKTAGVVSYFIVYR